MKLFKTYIPYLAVGAAAFVFAILSEWNDDAIAYSFYIPGSGEDESFTPIATLRDIWESQINHYSNSNGGLWHTSLYRYSAVFYPSLGSRSSMLLPGWLLYSASPVSATMQKTSAHPLGSYTRDTVVFHSPFHSSIPDKLRMDGMCSADMA